MDEEFEKYVNAVKKEGEDTIIRTVLQKLTAEEVAKLTHLPLDRILQVQQSMTH